VHVVDDADEGRLHMLEDSPYSISQYVPLAVEVLKNETFSHVILIDGAKRKLQYTVIFFFTFLVFEGNVQSVPRVTQCLQGV
jgi:hypothetical protein